MMRDLPSYTMEDLKKTAKSFLDRLSSASLESIENGWKMFALAYLNADLDDRQRESEAPALFRIIHREYLTALERSA